MPEPQSRLPFWSPVIAPTTKQRLAEVIDSNFLNDGPQTRRFEERLAELCGTRYAVAVTNATSAIFLSLAACGIGPGDDVLVPDLTFIATANAVRLAGAAPVLVDIDPVTFGMDPEAARQAITARTRAMIPVHISGRAAPMQPLLALARARGLRVIEDAAEALGSRLDAQALGTFGDLGCFSFSPNKTVTTGQGGMIVTNDERLYRRLAELKDQGRPVRGSGGDDEHPALGYNFKFTDLQAAVGLAQLEELEARVTHQRHLYRVYHEQLGDLPVLRLPGFQTERGECPQWVDVQLEERDALYDHLVAQGMHGRKFWFPLHTQGPYRQSADRFPVSTRVSRESMWLPSALALTDDDLQRVCREIREWAGIAQSKGA